MSLLDPSQIEFYRREGYVVLPDAVDPSAVDGLRLEADAAIRDERAALASEDGTASFLSRDGERYYVAGRHRRRPELDRFVRGPLMATICASLLGPDAFVFNELFVCKAPHPLSGFVWHQDYAYLEQTGFGHYPPNLTVWIALDPATQESGALRVLPFSRVGDALRPHNLKLDWTREEVADFGDDPGTLLEVDPGTIIVLSGLLPHASGPNQSSTVRRAHLTQYSRQPIMDGDNLLQLATPVLADGQRVTKP